MDRQKLEHKATEFEPEDVQAYDSRMIYNFRSARMTLECYIKYFWYIRNVFEHSLLLRRRRETHGLTVVLLLCLANWKGTSIKVEKSSSKSEMSYFSSTRLRRADNATICKEQSRIHVRSMVFGKAGHSKTKSATRSQRDFLVA